MAAYGLDPPFIGANSNWFAITFQRKGFQEVIEKNPSIPFAADRVGGVNGGVSGGVNEGIEKVLDLFREPRGFGRHKYPRQYKCQ